MSEKTQNTNPDELGWDDELEPTVYTVLPEGPGTFEILDFSRTRKTKGKLGECNIAVLKLLVEHTESGETATFDEELPLHKKLQFLLLQFFAAIGQREHGSDGPFCPDWSRKAIVGQTGNCVIGVRTWKKKDGSDASQNEIKTWLAPGEQPGGLQF